MLSDSDVFTSYLCTLEEKQPSSKRSLPLPRLVLGRNVGDHLQLVHILGLIRTLWMRNVAGQWGLVMDSRPSWARHLAAAGTSKTPSTSATTWRNIAQQQVQRGSGSSGSGAVHPCGPRDGGSMDTPPPVFRCMWPPVWRGWGRWKEKALVLATGNPGHQVDPIQGKNRGDPQDKLVSYSFGCVFS